MLGAEDILIGLIIGFLMVCGMLFAASATTVKVCKHYKAGRSVSVIPDFLVNVGLFAIC